jgi:amino acid adenylation domain-containing protein
MANAGAGMLVYDRTIVGERRTTSVTGGSTRGASPAGHRTTVYELVRPSLHRFTDRLAVFGHDGRRVTFGELDAAAGRLAALLRAQTGGPEAVIGVRMERSPELVVAVLAILRAGCVYLPLEPSYPAARVRYMTATARASLVLTSHDCAAGMEDRDVPIWLLDRELGPDARAALPCPPPVAASPDNLAYILYTSGSTGAPKGVMVSHASLVNRLLWMQRRYRLGTEDRVLHKTPIGFDVSLWELLWPLMTGATMVLAEPGGHQDAGYLGDLIEACSVTVVHFVPSFLDTFLAFPDVAGRCRTLRLCVASGEELSPELARRFLAAMPTVALENLYGPTEAAIDVSWFDCGRGTYQRTVPIGRAIDNTRLAVVDDRLRPLAPGEAGELVIGGVPVARGYAAASGQTASSFVPDPEVPGQRLYRTGDLARTRADGEIEYLGRLDNQVKLNGQRIELEEIEAALRRQPGVRTAIVVVGGARRDRLTAFVTMSGGPSDGTAGLSATLRTSLPPFMIPDRFVRLSTMPTTPNGKADRRLLSSWASDGRWLVDARRNEKEY